MSGARPASSKPSPAPGPAPSEPALREAAVQHLARYATTCAGLTRVLERRIARWASLANADAEAIKDLRRTAHDVITALRAEGLLDDAAFAENRARRLVRSGHSHRAVMAHLAARGVAQAAVPSATPADQELAAALATARRRRIGPFRVGAEEPQGHQRELAILARAGFTRDIALAALRTPQAEAAAIVLQLKRG